MPELAGRESAATKLGELAQLGIEQPMASRSVVVLGEDADRPSGDSARGSKKGGANKRFVFESESASKQKDEADLFDQLSRRDSKRSNSNETHRALNSEI